MHSFLRRCPVAVPKISFAALSCRNFDRGHSLTSLHPPLAALGSLPAYRRCYRGGAEAHRRRDRGYHQGYVISPQKAYKRDGVSRLFFVLVCCLPCHFVGADDSVGPVGNGTVIVRAGRVARPYNLLSYLSVGRAPCGPPHDTLHAIDGGAHWPRPYKRLSYPRCVHRAARCGHRALRNSIGGRSAGWLLLNVWQGQIVNFSRGAYGGIAKRCRAW